MTFAGFIAEFRNFCFLRFFRWWFLPVRKLRLRYIRDQKCKSYTIQTQKHICMHIKSLLGLMEKNNIYDSPVISPCSSLMNPWYWTTFPFSLTLLFLLVYMLRLRIYKKNFILFLKIPSAIFYLPLGDFYQYIIF